MHAPRNLYDRNALRVVEAQATTALGGDGFDLMRRAGECGWRHLLEHWPDAAGITVVCGPGNNGGDGYVLARLAHASGREVRVVRLQAHAPRGELGRRACDEFTSGGGSVISGSQGLPRSDLFVDAIFGIGLSRAPDAATAALIEAINAQDAPVFSLDVPSGVDSDSGHCPGVAVDATRTLQFIAAHRGLQTGPALDRTGGLALATLDLPDAAFEGVQPAARRLDAEDLGRYLRPRSRDSHKGRYGHVLCIGGDEGMGGAIALCAEAALRAGAGLVSVATRPTNVAPLLARRPEAMVRGVDSPTDVRASVEAASVIAVGPGLGRSAWSRAVFSSLREVTRPVVIDADALTLLSESCGTSPDAILTPHPGEAARLLGTTTAQVQPDRYAAAAALARAHACTIVLKGGGTIVASPDHVPCVIAAGNPGMASGGMGDVLTGVIAALRAQGLSAFDSACCGALLHALAGDAVAAAGGQRGMLASDLFPHLRSLANPPPGHPR